MSDAAHRASNVALTSLSPSRAAMFKSCGLRFKYRYVDDLEEPKTKATLLGNLVHATLEEFIKLPALTRNRRFAFALLDTLLNASDREWSDLLDADDLRSAQRFVVNYLLMEDVTSVRARELELRVSHVVDDIEFRGVIDRLDDDWSLVDYKTGRAPDERFENAAFFGLRFYAWLCARSLNIMPTKLRLLYLDTKETITIEPSAQMIDSFERQVLALAAAINRSIEQDRFMPQTSALCKVCAYIDRCPKFNGRKVSE